MKLFLFLILLSLPLFSTEAFISAENLHEKIGTKTLKILDVGNVKLYRENHIPTAVHVDMAEWCKPVDEHYEMQDRNTLLKLVQKLGIENDSLVVIYDHNRPNGLLNASFIALALHRLGHKNFTILNGSFEEWLFVYEGVKGETIATHSNYRPSYNDDVLVGSAYVKKHIDKVPMLDARVSKYYFGTYKSSGVYRLGHIKGAKSSYWKNSFLSDNTLAERAILEAIFLQGLALEADKEVLVYGLNGYEASMNWYILYKIFGFSKLKVYDASLQEWGNHDETAMVAYAWE